GLAQLYTQIAASAASAALGSGILVLLGFSPLPASFPLVTFARAHPVTALTLGTVLLGVLAAVLVVAQRERTLRPHAEAQVTRFVLFATLSAVGGALLSVVFGFSTLPTSIPLIDLIRTHTPLGISLLAVPLALMVCAPLFSLWGESPTAGGAGRAPVPGAGSHGGPAGRGGLSRLGGKRAPLLLSTAISARSSLPFVSLPTTVLARPPWCPPALCPAPVTLTNPYGTHDAFLEIVPTAVQSATYVIPGDPTQYALQQNNLPHDIGAVRLDDASFPPYRVVLGVHNL